MRMGMKPELRIKTSELNMAPPPGPGDEKAHSCHYGPCFAFPVNAVMMDYIALHKALYPIAGDITARAASVKTFSAAPLPSPGMR
jgi:hypothetical protein